jgi:hypothetical protein
MTQTESEFPDGVAYPGIGSVLECRIEPASEYHLGQPITIKGTLHNSGSSAVWVLSWNTFLDPTWQDCVLVTHNGSPVPYVSIAVFRLAPGRDAYIRIPAGESVSSQIDLSQRYAITQPGDYEVSFYLPILGALDEGDPEPPADQRSLQPTLVESAKVSFRIDGVASKETDINAEGLSFLSTSPAETGITPPQYIPMSIPGMPVAPRCVGLNPQQLEKVELAHYTAYDCLRIALQNMENWGDNEGGDSWYDKWFESKNTQGYRGKGWEGRWHTVFANLKTMVAWMTLKDSPIWYMKEDKDKTCSFDVIAWTAAGGKGAIHLCGNFFDDDYMRVTHFSSADWARATAVIHEISHAFAGTKDLWGSRMACSNLASFYPELAVVNAQNYALYVMMRQSSTG